MLGLAPNMARISIRFYLRLHVGEVVRNLCQYFDDLKIVRPEFDSELMPIARIVRALAVRGESDRIHHTLVASFFQSILSGAPFPEMVLSSALERIARDHDDTSRNLYDATRCSIIKAALLREARRSARPELEFQPGVYMDEACENVAYRLGRLLAVMDHMQRNALGKVNTTIRDRFFAGAAARPAVVFPQLFDLNRHHLKKLGGGAQTHFEKLMQEILEPLGPDTAFPTYLPPRDRAIFALGWYHQRQALYQKKESAETSDTDAEEEELAFAE